MNGIMELFFPRGASCLVCGDPRRADPEFGLCPECRKALLDLRLRGNTCIRCMHPLNIKGICPFCKTDGLGPVRAGYGAYRYTGAAAALIKALKFGYRDEAAAALAAGMAQCFPSDEYDALVPVPLYPARQRARGVNQSRLLCDRVGQLTGLPVMDILLRTRDTQAQTRLHSREKRARNVRDAFRAGEDTKGLRLLLVDDVRTTGATARACGETLIRSGALYVDLLTAAIAPRGGSGSDAGNRKRTLVRS